MTNPDGIPADLEALLVPEVLAHRDEDIALRHHLHAHPELAFQEHETGDLVAARLAEYGYTVRRGLGGTGVVGSLRRGAGGKRLGLRADMDALPIPEATGLPYASLSPGRMHACGHDGHVTALLAAARHLARHGRFNGTLNLIFQPAEEGQGGARRMLEDGLLDLFPCDGVFAFHNHPGYPVGRFGTLPGLFMASSDTVVIDLQGRGGHGSMPHLCVDAAVAAAYIVVALQTIVARNVDPRDMAVVTVGVLQAGSVVNAIPDSAHLELSVRAYDPGVRAWLRERIPALVRQQAQTFGAEAAIDYRWRYPALVNDPDLTAFVRRVIGDWLGEAGFVRDVKPSTGSEDFAFLLEKCPGCYVDIGNGDGPDLVSLHHPRFDFNDALLPVAASYWVRLAEAFLA